MLSRIGQEEQQAELSQLLLVMLRYLRNAPSENHAVFNMPYELSPGISASL